MKKIILFSWLLLSGTLSAMEEADSAEPKVERVSAGGWVSYNGRVAYTQGMITATKNSNGSFSGIEWLKNGMSRKLSDQEARNGFFLLQNQYEESNSKKLEWLMFN